MAKFTIHQQSGQIHQADVITIGSQDNRQTNWQQLVPGLAEVIEQLDAQHHAGTVSPDVYADIRKELEAARSEAASSAPSVGRLDSFLQRAKSLSDGVASLSGMVRSIDGIVDIAKQMS